jgi:quaternary ammonium compound-resistance protein SugE
MAWLFVLVAGLFEVAWAVGLKQTDGFTRLGPSILTLVGMGISFVLLAMAMRTLPAGTAYAVWTGIGAVGTALAGILWLDEPATAARVASLLLIAIGIVGLKLAGE